MVWLSVFLLPWQLRHTVMFATINGGYFEYGSWHIYATDLVIIALLVCWVLRPDKKFFAGPRWLSAPLLTLLVWMTLSVSWAVDKPLAMITAGHWWLAYLWYLYLLNRIQAISQLIRPLMWGVGLQALWGVVQYFLNQSLGFPWLGESILNAQVSGIPVVMANGVRQLRAHGMLPHANMLGGLLAVATPVLIYYYTTLERSKLSRQLVQIIMLVVVGVGLSFARGAWLVLGVGLLVVIILGWSAKREEHNSADKRWRNRRQFNIAGGALLLFGLVLATQYQFVINRFDLSDRLEQRSVEERITGVTNWEKIAGQYMVRGAGIGGYTVALQKLDSTQPVWWNQPVHNVYLLMIGELGVVGVAIWAWLIAVLVWVQVKWLRFKENWLLVLPIDAWLALGLVDHWLVSLQQGRLLLFLALVLIILVDRVSLIKPESKLY